MWRAARARLRPWKRARPGPWKPPAWPGSEDVEPEVLSPGTLAGLYRALRKGREDGGPVHQAALIVHGLFDPVQHLVECGAKERDLVVPAGRGQPASRIGGRDCREPSGRKA